MNNNTQNSTRAKAKDEWRTVGANLKVWQCFLYCLKGDAKLNKVIQADDQKSKYEVNEMRNEVTS